MNSGSVLKLYLLNESQLAFLYLCFQPLQMLDPAPSKEIIAPYLNENQLLNTLKTPRDVELFAAQMTVQILWSRFEQIIKSTEEPQTKDLFSNWTIVFSELESRLKNRRYLGLDSQLQCAYDTMKTVFLYVTHINGTTIQRLGDATVLKHIGFMQEMQYHALEYQLLFALYLAGPFDRKVNQYI